MGFREEECWDDPDGEEGFSSRANIVEASHASFLRSLGGRKMGLDITAAVLVSGAGMLLQMSDAKARREALTKPAGGPTLLDNQRRNQAWQRRLDETREELRSGGSVQEGERQFARRVQEAGYVTDPVGTDRIESRTKRRRDTVETGRREATEGEGDEEEGTHRADTTRREEWKKRSRWSAMEGDGEEVGGSGIHRDVREAVGEMTDEEFRDQTRELERLREEKQAKSKTGSLWDEDLPVEERDELERLREEIDEGEAELRRKRHREEGERSEEDAGEGDGESGGERAQAAEERTQQEEHLEQRVPDTYHRDARLHRTDWGLARLKDTTAASAAERRFGRTALWGALSP